MENGDVGGKDIYRTKDLSEAAALTAKGAKLLRLEQEQNFYWFVFADKNSCEHSSNAYWAGELQVDAKEYATSIKTLKDRLFARR
ncbi:MAG: hypothetical protein A3C30_03470 [Candidatus Levybacteria bacterium RIFCSPHIGHO2_02_FULL_40_18]|uniref:DUF5659 domain-containing protein n=1 Tax=Candidatus Woesebacteria bacterium RIFCSPLOWO2_01_FULL_39_25 TaxID=1802521 RepID=A0A1F8BMK6_9BACT|nr:MAG: hypothetical protein A3C30_03470 [Candidatus Levybacteria bacterium RIFCSPHIGHO2_02_FULL_40_18]OGH31402.1 MAG: hypothetical protein A3E43_03450 [Candidatus Levybacteria bacterium RIFCSPHIGHO2_12_FULL_40_31]OGM65242.1 MAG: hypothetical protein A2893_00605 [Candidatus Woesebacteria bacterium RIFCSPLOWO2_01_FULL_39_25]